MRGPADGTPQKAEYDAACDRISELVQRIADTPSAGPIGLAVKCFLRHHDLADIGYGSPPEMLGEFLVECAEDALELSIIEDAVRFAPELGPLAAPALESDEKEAA
jgi:hypothetical protein